MEDKSNSTNTPSEEVSKTKATPLTDTVTTSSSTSTASTDSSQEYNQTLTYIGLGANAFAYLMLCASLIIPFVGCLGFIFAIAGSVLGFIQRPKAKAAGKSTTLDVLNIGLGLFYIFLNLCLICLAFVGGAALLASAPELADPSLYNF